MPRLLSLPWGDHYTIEGLTVRKRFLIFCHNFPMLRFIPFYLVTHSWTTLTSLIATSLQNTMRASTRPPPFFFFVLLFLLGIKHIEEKSVVSTTGIIIGVVLVLRCTDHSASNKAPPRGTVFCAHPLRKDAKGWTKGSLGKNIQLEMLHYYCGKKNLLLTQKSSLIINN